MKKQEYLERARVDNSPAFLEHFTRYRFAGKFVKEKTVLDAGCGNGYGSFYLAQFAKQVIGIDISEEAIAFCQQRYQKSNLAYRRMDCLKLEFTDGTFDIACSFEVIEHIRQYQGFLKEITRVLKKDGITIISTPHAKIPTVPANPYHFKEFKAEEFEQLLLSNFTNVEILGQCETEKIKEVYHGTSVKRFLSKIDFFRIHDLIPRDIYSKLCRLFGFAIEEDITVDDYEIFRYALEKANVLLAVCRK